MVYWSIMQKPDAKRNHLLRKSAFLFALFLRLPTCFLARMNESRIRAFLFRSLFSDTLDLVQGLYQFQQRLSFRISVFNGLQKASADMRPATSNLAVQFFIGHVRVSDDCSGVISEQTFCHIPGSGGRKVIGYHRWPDSRQSAPQIRLLTLLCPLDQLFDERFIHVEDITLHNSVDHPLIQRQQGICRTFVEIFQRRRSHRKSFVAEHPRLTFQGDGILHFIRNYFGNKRGVITSSAADRIKHISRGGSRNNAAQRVRGIGIFGAFEMNAA